VKKKRKGTREKHVKACHGGKKKGGMGGPRNAPFVVLLLDPKGGDWSRGLR